MPEPISPSYDAQSILEFPSGLPGFDWARRFALVENPGTAPALLLQSLESTDLCFVVVAVDAVDDAYDLALSPEDFADIGEYAAPGDILCLAILTAAENGQLTANLLAPVVVNRQTRRAVQAVRNDRRYSHQHLIAPAQSLAPIVETSCL